MLQHVGHELHPIGRAGGGSRSVSPSQANTLPPSLKAPPSSVSRLPTRYAHSPGATSGSAAGSTIRKAPVVPTVRASRRASTQPLPTLADAPSPTPSRNGTSASAGQRRANGRDKP